MACNALPRVGELLWKTHMLWRYSPVSFGGPRGHTTKPAPREFQLEWMGP